MAQHFIISHCHLQKKKPTFDSDDDNDMDLGDVAPRERGGGRARKAVKYNFGNDSGEEDDEF